MKQQTKTVRFLLDVMKSAAFLDVQKHSGTLECHLLITVKTRQGREFFS